MKRIDKSKLEKGLMVTGINLKTVGAKLIRKGVHSFTNHNGMVAERFDQMGIAEAVSPYSKFTSIESYEKIMNDDGYRIGFYRLKALVPEEREAAADFFISNLLNLPYPHKSSMIVLALPIYNALVDKLVFIPSIRLTWCSQLVARSYISVDPHCLDGIEGKKKQLFTPKTFENRIIDHLFEDLTDQIIIEE